MKIEEAKELVDNSNFYGKTISVIKAEVHAIIDQLNPPKPEIPQFVADWYEKHKDSLEYYIWEYINEWDNQEQDDFFNFMNYGTFKPIQTLVNMHQFGYEIEQKKLYTVDLPNGQPLVSGKNTLYFSQNLAAENVKLTESEIRKDFDWAWQFAEEVTE
ncbi:DUF1642 domain-containing protein [Streptococcus agalactiae]|nr:DUF1642 domain-containing protein [Streptococcus agalactiae]HEN6426240.1 DUF1642 domain-containing protein [Streptococcus agalactiae]HEN6661753.1 DUF1642 domain-containing protein [Streptococcus agalactiae]HEN7501327.1 DUF1642 domain-containing protein [Streptococcus agalactiae]HEN7654495.1 DUF1642 domain-containing protein [Streptococcus agalactiae]